MQCERDQGQFENKLLLFFLSGDQSIAELTVFCFTE